MSRPIIVLISVAFWSTSVHPRAIATAAGDNAAWHLSVQYLGLTWHPGGGGSPEVYPLKCEKKGYLVPEVGAAGNIDRRLNRLFFLRFTVSLYKDCAFLTAGCLHAGPRIQYTRGRNSLNLGIGPILLLGAPMKLI